MKVDFNNAKTKHFEWQIRVRNFLDGQTLLTESEVLSHRHCELGKWYYSEGKGLYGHLKTMQDFELEHEELHKLIGEIRQLKLSNKGWEAEAGFNKLQRISRNIISLLTQAEKEINNS